MRIKVALLFVSFLMFQSFLAITTLGQELTSPNYKILDPTVDSGGGAGDSTNYSILFSTGNPTADARLTSGSYAVGSGFPNGIQANVPLIKCAETDTLTGNTDCLNFPNGNGAQGECGTPGCYDRFKLEIDYQDNPVDALFLVSITEVSSGIEYFLQSDNTIDTTYDINDYQTICQLEGADSRSGSGCQNSGDPEWDETLQSSNVYGLGGNVTYSVKTRALNGDFTESQWGPSVQVTTLEPTLALDIDIGPTTAADTLSPHNINFEKIQPATVETADDKIWIDQNTNLVNGFSLYIKDLNSGLDNGNSDLIPSETEDISVDPNGNGGFGVQEFSIAEDNFGPLKVDAAFDLSGDSVRGLSPTEQLLFFTQNSGSDKGIITNGRGSLTLKLLAPINIESGSYTDTLTFTMVANP